MVNEIRLSNGQNDLECENKDNIKICNINKTHFLEKESGYHFITHSTNYGKYVSNERLLDLGSFGFNVVINKEEKLLFSPFILIVLLGLMLF